MGAQSRSWADATLIGNSSPEEPKALGGCAGALRNDGAQVACHNGCSGAQTFPSLFKEEKRKYHSVLLIQNVVMNLPDLLPESMHKES